MASIGPWLPLVSVALTLTVATPSAAQTETHALRWDAALDGTITASGAAAFVASEFVFKDALAPSGCRWCDVDSMDASVRQALVWRDTGTADTTSNVTGFVLMPLTSVGLSALAALHDHAGGNIGQDALLIAEAWVLTADVTQLAKMTAGRERPFVHALPPDAKAHTGQPSDNNLSFFSGHASTTFALATSSGTIATMRGYRWSPVVWAAGGAVAATTAYLRIAADKHWLTDVLVGALVGAGIGFGVPYFFHSPIDDPSPRATAAVRSRALPAATLLSYAW